MTGPKRILILGSTGSIGTQTIDVVGAHPDLLRIVGLAAGSNAAALSRQAADLGVEMIALADEQAAANLASANTFAGAQGICDLVTACEPDLVVGAISGSAGLRPLLTALEAGIDCALANKEPLVVAGKIVTDTARKSGAQLLPVDSELSAMFQCMRGERADEVARILLTASGGPFSKLSAEELARVTPDQALAHPTWRMGRKVTIDSATLANKGFEVFETLWLFGVDARQIEVVVHHQSIIHSLVEFQDSSIIAQVGLPDMRVAIQFALTYPDRVANDLPRLSLAEVGTLTFAKPDTERFPCLRLAMEAARAGATYPAALNGADEAAVAAFLAGAIGFMRIPELIEQALSEHEPGDATSLNEVEQADAWARKCVCRNV